MKIIAGLLLAFAVMVGGIEGLHVLSAWWQAGRPAPGMREWLALAALAVALVLWWRHSRLGCDKSCLTPEPKENEPRPR